MLAPLNSLIITLMTHLKKHKHGGGTSNPPPLKVKLRQLQEKPLNIIPSHN